MKKIIAPIVGLVVAGLLAACTPAEVASSNISQDSDNFRIMRRITFVNGITDKYLLTIEGLCSIKADSADKQIEVTCKTDEGKYKKHYLGLSDNVTYVVEQVERPIPTRSITRLCIARRLWCRTLICRLPRSRVADGPLRGWVPRW